MERLLTSLHDLLDPETQPPPGAPSPLSFFKLGLKCRVLHDVASGLAYLNEQSPPIIHRNLTARDILLSSSLVAKIGGLGKACTVPHVRAAMKMTGVPGSHVYMPPEAIAPADSNAKNSLYDGSIDIFSLGVVTIFTIGETFPCNPLAPTYVDQESGLLRTHTELQRRSEYMRSVNTQLRACGQLRGDHPLIQLIQQCLQNAPSKRSSIREVLYLIELARGGIEDEESERNKEELIRALQNHPQKQNLEQVFEDLVKDNTQLQQRIRSKESELINVEESVKRAEEERDRVRVEKWEAEGERDRARVEKQEAEVERDRVRVEWQQAQGRAYMLQRRLEGERDRARMELQQALGRADELQRRLDELQRREHERSIVQEQAIAAEQRGPSWVVKEDELEVTEERLGVGGWAEVKVAKLKVAAKCLHEQLIYDYHRCLFRREMDVAARVSHPNLLRFLRARLEGGIAILIEFMPTSLRALVNRRPRQRLSPKHILSIAIDVVCALNYLHHMTPDPIIHRDLSSANVLLQPTPNGGWLAKVSDYGTANFQSQLQTENPGSPVYTATESRDPALQTPKMDIYSFGILLVEMCTCEFPAPERRAELIQSIRYPQLVDLITQCLNEDPDRRPTAALLVDLLQAMQ